MEHQRQPIGLRVIVAIMFVVLWFSSASVAGPIWLYRRRLAASSKLVRSRIPYAFSILTALAAVGLLLGTDRPDLLDVAELLLILSIVSFYSLLAIWSKSAYENRGRSLGLSKPVPVLVILYQVPYLILKGYGVTGPNHYLGII